MGIALNRLAQEDPSFRVHWHRRKAVRPLSPVWVSSTSTFLSTVCVVSSTLKPASANLQVAYRETIRSTVENAEAKFVKQSGGRGQYGRCAEA